MLIMSRLPSRLPYALFTIAYLAALSIPTKLAPRAWLPASMTILAEWALVVEYLLDGAPLAIIRLHDTNVAFVAEVL